MITFNQFILGRCSRCFREKTSLCLCPYFWPWLQYAVSNGSFILSDVEYTTYIYSTISFLGVAAEMPADVEAERCFLLNSSYGFKVFLLNCQKLSKMISQICFSIEVYFRGFSMQTCRRMICYSLHYDNLSTRLKEVGGSNILRMPHSM